MTSARVTEPGLYPGVCPTESRTTKGRSRGRRIVVSLSAIALVSILVLALGVLKTNPNSPPMHATASDVDSWMFSTIDSTGDVGLQSSIAVDSNSGVHISYLDNTNGDLKYATNADGSWA